MLSHRFELLNAFPFRRHIGGPSPPQISSRTVYHLALRSDVEALLQKELSIQPSQTIGFGSGWLSQLDGVDDLQDIQQAIDTLLLLASRERVKHLILTHPGLLLKGSCPGMLAWRLHLHGGAYICTHGRVSSWDACVPYYCAVGRNDSDIF